MAELSGEVLAPVAVCVAPSDSHPEVDPLEGRVREDPIKATLPAPEAAAAELALRAGEQWGLPVVAFCYGPPQQLAALGELVALGIQVVCVVPWGWGGAHQEPPGPRQLSPAEVAGEPVRSARALAWAITEQGGASLVVCGDRSARTGTSAVPPLLAATLGLASALGAVGVELEGRPGSLRVRRRLDRGWREELVVRAPAVISVEAVGLRLRRAPLAGLLDPPQHSGQVTVLEEPPPGPRQAHVSFGQPRPYRPRPRSIKPPQGDVHERVVALAGIALRRDPPRVVGPLEPATAASELLEFLAKREGLVLGGPGKRP